MANSAEVYAALRIVGVSCRGVGNGETWATEAAPSWSREMKHIQPKHVQETARTWIRTEDRRPSLHQFMTLLKQVRGRDVKRDEVEGCAHCAGSGWRDVAVHWQPDPSRERKAASYTVPCDCERGRLFCQDNRSFDDVIRDLQKRPGFIELHYTNRDRTALPLSLRIAPHQYEKLQQRPKRRYLDFGGDS